MSGSHNTLCIDSFYPETELKITEIQQDKEQILIRMKSISKKCKCPKCGCITDKYHGTYMRKVQDLPILGKRVQLEICSHEYKCMNNECDVMTIAETFDGFLNNYSRMTERCADFICTLAMETSCEGCARICKALGIKISGDTVIRLLLKRYESLPVPEVGDVIGVDDFAYKKRHAYGTIIVNEKTHEPITLPDGRNGATLREWLRNHKNIKVVTRDRASVYAKVISEELPDAMQVADRFHLHQNLLEAIKKALNHELPATVSIPHVGQSTAIEEPCKKIESDVDNPPAFSEKRYKMICQIQKFLTEGCSYREIAKRMGVGRNTIAKYREGDPKELSMYGIQQSKLDPYYNFIVQCLNTGWSKSKTVKAIYGKGYTDSTSNAFQYLCKIEDKKNKYFEPQPYARTMTEGLKYRTGSIGKEKGLYHTWRGISIYMDEYRINNST